MNWIQSIAIGVLTGVVGCVGAGFVGALCARWYRISSFEGASGYYVVMIALLGAIVGLVGGVPLAVGSGYVVRQQLFGVQPTDEFTLLAVAAMMLTVSIAASIVPALRAAKVNPATTLRHESM